MVPKPKSALIIGGGPSGLVSLRNLIERGDFERVELVERRDDIGGVWHLDSYSDDQPHHNPPLHNLGEPNINQQQNAVSAVPRWISPAYPGLVGNVLPEFLSFSEFPFPERTAEHPHQPFPTLDETQTYLRSFAAPYIQRGVVRLNWEVERVEEQEDGRWKVYLKDWNGGSLRKRSVEIWDAIVVAVGWYDNPVWPGTEGLEEIKSKGLAMHARCYRGPEGFDGKRILVVGNAASSNDIAAHLAPVAKTPIYQSIRRPAFPGFPSLPDERIKMVAPVAKYTINNSLSTGSLVVEATLSDGTVLSDIGIVIFGTGHRPCPSFVYVLKHELMKNDSTESGLLPLAAPDIKPYRVPYIHRHILYAFNPTLAFIGLPMAFTPFTVADISSTWLTLAWSGDLPYPETPEGRLEFEKAKLETLQKFIENTENPTSFLAFSVLASDEEGYCAGLREDVVKARPELDKVLTVWSDEKTKEREAMYPRKLQALRYEREHGLR